jgi:hypothetical protein
MLSFKVRHITATTTDEVWRDLLHDTRPPQQQLYNAFITCTSPRKSSLIRKTTLDWSVFYSLDKGFHWYEKQASLLSQPRIQQSQPYLDHSSKPPQPRVTSPFRTHPQILNRVRSTFRFPRRIVPDSLCWLFATSCTIAETQLRATTRDVCHYRLTLGTMDLKSFTPSSSPQSIHRKCMNLSADASKPQSFHPIDLYLLELHSANIQIGNSRIIYHWECQNKQKRSTRTTALAARTTKLAASTVEIPASDIRNRSIRVVVAPVSS